MIARTPLILALACATMGPLGGHAFAPFKKTSVSTTPQRQQPKLPFLGRSRQRQQLDATPSRAPRKTRLFSSNQDTTPGNSSSSSSLNLGLIAQNLANQAVIGSTIWTGGAQFQVLVQKASFEPTGIAFGVLGLIPLLALSRRIETSESYLVSGLNLSTNMAVLRLFGSQSQPVTAGILSAVMAGLTGVVEEVTFRGQLIPVLANSLGGGNVLVGATLSTVLFALLHTNPLALVNPRNKDAFLDNLVLLVLQLVNGAIFAWLYLSTGNLAVSIVAHALYDFYTFYKTHLVDVAGQMEYAQAEAKMPSFKSQRVEQRWVQERGADFVTEAKKSFYLMDTNQNGVLSRKELRVALFSYGINLSKLQSQKVTQSADLDESGDIDLDEFLEYIGPTGSTGKAVRNTLFGPI